MERFGVALKCRKLIVRLNLVPKRTNVNTGSSQTHPFAFSGNATLDRLQAFAGVPTDAEFARKYDISANTLKKWRLRDTMPLGLVARFALEYGLSLDWILAGRGPKHAQDSAIPASDTPLDESLLTLSVETLRRELDGANLELPSDKFARAVVLVYSLLADVPEREKSAGGHVKRVLRLVV